MRSNTTKHQTTPCERLSVPDTNLKDSCCWACGQRYTLDFKIACPRASDDILHTLALNQTTEPGDAVVATKVRRTPSPSGSALHRASWRSPPHQLDMFRVWRCMTDGSAGNCWCKKSNCNHSCAESTPTILAGRPSGLLPQKRGPFLARDCLHVVRSMPRLASSISRMASASALAS